MKYDLKWSADHIGYWTAGLWKICCERDGWFFIDYEGIATGKRFEKLTEAIKYCNDHELARGPLTFADLEYSNTSTGSPWVHRSSGLRIHIDAYTTGKFGINYGPSEFDSLKQALDAINSDRANLFSSLGKEQC